MATKRKSFFSKNTNQEKK